MSSWGDAHEAPRLTDVLTALEQPTHSIEINLAALPPETRPVFVDALLLQLQALHDRAGRPHCILIHHAASVSDRQRRRAPPSGGCRKSR